MNEQSNLLLESEIILFVWTNNWLLLIADVTRDASLQNEDEKYLIEEYNDMTISSTPRYEKIIYISVLV